MKRSLSAVVMAVFGIALSLGAPAAIAQGKSDSEEAAKKKKPPEKTKDKPKKEEKQKEPKDPPLVPIPKTKPGQ